MKPMRRRPRKPTEAEVEQVIGLLHGDRIPADDKFAARLIVQVWTVAPKMPASDIVAELAEQLHREWQATRKRVPLQWFSWTRMKGIGALWIRRRQAEAAAAAEALEMPAPVQSDDPDPPPVIHIPRKDFPS